MILVMGSSGTVGKEVVRELAARGARFRAGYRSEEQARLAREAGIESVVLDYAQPDTLRAALEGVERAFFVTPPIPELAELETNVVEAACGARVKHLVKLSVWGADRGKFIFGRPHQQIEKLVEASGVSYTFLRPNSFMQNLLGQAEAIRAQGAFYLPAGDARVSEIDVRDVGSVAAAVLTSAGHEGKAYELTGPEALSNEERAEVLSSVLGRKIAYVSPPDPEWKAAAVSMGIPEWTAEAIVDLQHYYKAGKAQRVAPFVQELTEQAPTPFRRFVEDHVEAFR